MAKKTGAKKTAFGADLIEGMKLVLAHQRGKMELEQGLAETDRREGNSQACENVAGGILSSVSNQQARIAGVGAGRAATRFGRSGMI